MSHNGIRENARRECAEGPLSAVTADTHRYSYLVRSAPKTDLRSIAPGRGGSTFPGYWPGGDCSVRTGLGTPRPDGRYRCTTSCSYFLFDHFIGSGEQIGRQL